MVRSGYQPAAITGEGHGPSSGYRKLSQLKARCHIKDPGDAATFPLRPVRCLHSDCQHPGIGRECDAPTVLMRLLPCQFQRAVRGHFPDGGGAIRSIGASCDQFAIRGNGYAPTGAAGGRGGKRGFEIFRMNHAEDSATAGRDDELVIRCERDPIDSTFYGGGNDRCVVSACFPPQFPPFDATPVHLTGAGDISTQ